MSSALASSIFEFIWRCQPENDLISQVPESGTGPRFLLTGSSPALSFAPILERGLTGGIVPRLTILVLPYLIACSGLPRAEAQYFPPKDSQGMTVAQTAINAMGGAAALQMYQDSLATGTLTDYANDSAVSYSVTYKTKGTQETRIEVQMPDGLHIRIVNQGVGEIQKPNGTVLNLLWNNTFGETVNHIPILSLLSQYQNSNVGVQSQGTALANNQNTNVVALTYVPTTDPNQAPAYADMTKTLFYVDQTTGLVDEVQYTNYAEDNPDSTAIMQVYFANYQAINGMLVPFHQTIYDDGTLEADILLSTVSFNVGLTDSVFGLR